ncbi:MAG: PilZ domain-containing protein [Deltaproteobacteria bacterium]|nr:PilZ domain-containing protein [Deltaproteobacteria bacterium]
MRSTRKNLRHIISQAVMGTDNRRHTRAKVKWPVSINAPTGLVDGTTENLSLSGAFIRLSRQLNCSAEIPLVLNAKGRFIPCTAQVVWSDERNLSDQRKFLGIGVRFTRMMLHDREFLHGEISNHT